MKIVACPGYSATLRIANVSISITQFAAVDLSAYTNTEIRRSNLQVLKAAKWVEEYTGQELPEKTNVKVELPTVEQVVESGEKNTQVKFTQKTVGKRVETSVDMSEDLPGKLAAQVIENKKAQEKELKQVAVDIGGDANVANVNELTIKKLTNEELQRTTVVDGKKVEDFKFPRAKKTEKVEDNTSLDDGE